MTGEDPHGTSIPKVLDFETLADLESLIGSARLTSMMRTFFADARRRALILAAEPGKPGALFEHAHALISLSGHFGFEELSELCAILQDEAQDASVSGRIAALSAAIDRAAEAVPSRLEAD